MGEIIKFPGRSEDSGEEKRGRVRRMEEGKFYDLNPPINRQGEIYERIQCEFPVLGQVGEYVVRGIPRSQTAPKSFILKFSAERGVIVSESEEQNF